MARIPSSRNTVHRGLRIPDLRAGDDSPLRTSFRHAALAIFHIRQLPTQRLRPCGLNATSRTRSQPCADDCSSRLSGPSRDAHAVPLRSHETRAGKFCDAVRLGHLPLALDHAAAFCKRTQMSFADYATRASSLIDAVPRGVGYPKSVAATFDLAITQAVAQCPTAEILMAFLAQCAPVRIPMALVEGAVDKETERLEALAALAEVSLVKHDPFEDGTPAKTAHRLFQA